MTHTELPRSTPSAEDLDAAGIQSFVDALELSPDIEPHGLILLRHGRTIADGWWAPFSADRPHLLYSLSKSFTSTALGLAVAEGLVDLDRPVLSYFPELDDEITDPRTRSILVRHVAAMASGHFEDTLDRARAIDPVDVMRGFLLIPPDAEPGSVFAYNQLCTFSLSAIVQRVSGTGLTEFLRPRLFDPLGIAETGWLLDPLGREIGFSGLHATTAAVAALGQLYLQHGRWEGRQLLPVEWVVEATRSHVATSAETNPDWQQGYGFQFWMSRRGFRGDGAYGQYCVVLPDLDAVLAITSETLDMQVVLDLVWQHLVPAFDRPGSGESADDQLKQQLSTLSVPPAVGGPAPSGTVPQSFVAANGNDQPTLTEVVLSGEPGRWTLTLVEGDDRLEVELGIGEWCVTDVVAAGGGWSGPAGAERLTVDLMFLETPHRLRLRCGTDDFECRWVTVPLHSPPLSGLRMPAPAPVDSMPTPR